LTPLANKQACGENTVYRTQFAITTKTAEPGTETTAFKSLDQDMINIVMIDLLNTLQAEDVC